MINSDNYPVYKDRDGNYSLAHNGCRTAVVKGDDTGVWTHDEVSAYLAEHEDALVPEPVPPPPTPEELAARRRAEIMRELGEIDLKTARAGRVIAIGRGTPDDIAYLDNYENQAEALRIELAALI